MAIWSPLTTHWAVNMQDCSSRGGVRVDTIIHHHAATSNKLVALSLFAPGGREVTPNYFIAGREIWGIVPEDFRAWTSGSSRDDARAMTYEILNSGNGPGWPIDPVTLDTVARLDADIASRYGVPLRHAQPGFMEHADVYEWFGRGYPTSCAGPGFSINQTIKKTAEIMAGKGKEQEVIPYRNQDGTARSKAGRTVLPGGTCYLHKTPGASMSNATNIVGGVGNYSVSVPVYATGTPGDALEVVLLFQTNPGKPNELNSHHYIKRMVFDTQGVIRDQLVCHPYVGGNAGPVAVYAKMSAPKSNRGGSQVTVFDSTALLHA